LAFSLAARAWERAGNREEADYYFYRHMVAKRSLKSWYDPRRWLEWLLIDLTCAYGTSWQRVLGTWFAVILISTLIFWLGGGIVSRGDGEPIRSFWRSLYFSIITFTTLGYGDYRPKRGGFRALASAEALIGAFMMALFVVVFARKFMR